MRPCVIKPNIYKENYYGTKHVQTNILHNKTCVKQRTDKQHVYTTAYYKIIFVQQTIIKQYNCKAN